MTKYVNVKPMVYASLFAALTSVGAFIKILIPISPVPITLQVFFVLLAGPILGAGGEGAVWLYM
jgi:biotin transport system substrate-specific component